jgi:hypothetical protein
MQILIDKDKYGTVDDSQFCVQVFKALDAYMKDPSCDWNAPVKEYNHVDWDKEDTSDMMCSQAGDDEQQSRSSKRQKMGGRMALVTPEMLEADCD